MNPNLKKKPRFYFNSQKTARTTIFWLYVLSIGFLIYTFTGLNSLEKKGYISAPQRGGYIEIYGDDAMATIYFYIGCSAFFFCIGSYYSILYIRIRRTQKETKKIIVPEICIPEKVVCPSCLSTKTIYFSTDLSCPKCNLQMEEIKGFIEKIPTKENRLEKNSNKDFLAKYSAEDMWIFLAVTIIAIFLCVLFIVMLRG